MDWITVILVLATAVLTAAIVGGYYRRGISKIIERVDRILNMGEDIQIDDYKEGKLGLLNNRISKVILVLKDRGELLMDEKKSLADSLADISHQIRTPLTACNLTLESMKASGLEDAKMRRLIFELGRQLEHIEMLVEYILKTAKMEAGVIALKKEKVDLRELVNAAVKPLEIIMEVKDISLEVDACGDFSGDFSWSTEALENILKNCVEHLDYGGKIFISGSKNPIYTELVVRDNGKGIDERDLPHLFDRFYRGSGSKGYGIGLALANTVVRQQNGTIKAENLSEGGACFTMRFYSDITDL